MDDLLLRLSCPGLKSAESGELRDGWECRSYLGGIVLGARSGFWNDSGVMEPFGCLDTCHHRVRVRF